MTSTIEVPFGPTGQVVYDRTYSRVKPNGEREVWPETVERVATGNLALVYGSDKSAWSEDVRYEHERLTGYMNRFAILPAGRHLWASGVKGRQYLFNCHVSGWGESFSKHFEFTFLRLMEGGGVGANYSSRFLEPYGAPRRALKVHIVCDPEHADYPEMLAAGVLSTEFDSDWHGAFEVEDSREGWADALVDLLDTFMTDDVVQHEDRVYDVSRVRKRGSRLKTFGGTASGPAPFATMMVEVGRVLSESGRGASFWGSDLAAHVTPVEAMELDHAIAECVVSGGNRRSARMSIVHWADPHIEDFLACKADGKKHWTTNISVEIDSDFLFDLKTEANLKAHRVHEAVVAGMLTNGEPGYWNSTLSNVGEPNEVTATNPCGEIALEEWENCNLGHVNLDAFAPTSAMKTDHLGLIEAHRLVTRFLIRATYGDVNDDGQAAKLARNRRIGVGHLGVQGFFAKRGLRYSQVPGDQSSASLLAELYELVREEARSYAFELRIPEPVKVTTVAPTGSIAKLPGVTEGIHPIYARHFIRRVRFSVSDPDQAAAVEAFRAEGFDVEVDVYDASGKTAVVCFPTKDQLVAEVEALGLSPDLVESADEISLTDMLAFQAMYQRWWADNAVSMTVNFPEGKLDHEDAARILTHWLPHLKGTTLMPDGTREQAPYTRISKAEFELYAVTVVEDGTDEDCQNGSCPVR